MKKLFKFAVYGFTGLYLVSSSSAFSENLSADEVKNIFPNLEARIENDPERGSYKWSVSFTPKGVWDAQNEYGKDAWGTWKINGSNICLVVKGGNQGFPSIYEGCIEVSINLETGKIKGSYLGTSITDSYIGTLERSSEFMRRRLAKAERLKKQVREKGEVRRNVDVARNKAKKEREINIEKNSKRNIIISIQKTLLKKGYYKDKVDGILSPRLLVGILSWSKANGFRFDGNISPELVSKLGISGAK